MDLDIFCCVETWCQEGRIEKQSWFTNIASEFIALIVPATKDKVMGRHKGGILIGVRNEQFNILKKTFLRQTFCLNYKTNEPYRLLK